MTASGRGQPAGVVSDRFFWELLGVAPGAARVELRRAYHKKARENHPDFYPESAKALQEIKMIALNEAYAHLMSLPEEPSGRTRDSRGEASGTCAMGSGARQGGATPPSDRPAVGRATAGPATAERTTPDTTEVGLHKEPAYAYYKQGFVHFSRGIHGIEALYQSMARHHRIHFRPRDDAYRRFAGSLVELRRAYEYFGRVVQDHPGSIWRRDAELKLSRIERFSALYRRIIGNLTAG